MKNSEILSAVLGGTFFAIPYLGLSIGILPSIVIGAGAFGASELIFHTNKKNTSNINMTPEEIIKDAQIKNSEIIKIASKIEDKEMVENIKNIYSTVNKIISTIEKKPEQVKKMGNFFDYYLPITVKILNKYDEIENQKLTNEESKKYMISTQNMIKKIKEAFENQLASLYKNDIVDADAEMKLFNNMLRADGFTNDDNLKM